MPKTASVASWIWEDNRCAHRPVPLGTSFRASAHHRFTVGGLMPSSPLRVGLGLLSVYPANNAGTTTYVHGLLSGLSKDHALEVHALTNPALGSMCGDLASSSMKVLGSRRYARMEQQLGRVPSLCISSALPIIIAGGFKEVDVVHYPQSVRSPRARRPVVVTLHDVQHLDLPHLFSKSVRAWRRMMYDESARRADAVITVSEHARSRIIDQLGVDANRVHVSYHGVDSRLFTPEPNTNDVEVRRRLGIEGPYIYYPASLAPHKNHTTLLRALRLLKETRLILTGPYSNRLAWLQAEINAYGLSDRVHHLGLLDAEELPALYRGASCLVFPSLYEGFGVPIAEAMSSGCPVACSDRGASVEIAGGAALVFDPDEPEAIADAVNRLDDPEIRGRCVADGLVRAAQFDWPSVARRHRRVYELVAR
jgi:glycosyltransferase involved in cell wall biosynthesis